MDYVAIDIETTGLDRGLCAIVEFGAVAVLDNETHEFTTVVKSDPDFSYFWEPGALAIHSHRLQDLVKPKKYVDVDKLYLAFNKWLKKIKFPSDDFVVAGKNFLNFDAQFLELHPGWDEHPWHRRVLDVGSMFAKASDKQPPCLYKIAADVLGKSPKKEDRNALNDARLVAELCAIHLNG